MGLPLGQTVYYAANGPTDRGTVTAFYYDCKDGPYWVEWANDDPPDWYREDQLVAVVLKHN